MLPTSLGGASLDFTHCGGVALINSSHKIEPCSHSWRVWLRRVYHSRPIIFNFSMGILFHIFPFSVRMVTHVVDL